MWRALLVLAVLAQPALADKAAKKPAKPAPDDAPESVQMQPTPQHSEGDYGGVVPGQPQRKPEGSKRPQKPPPKGTLAWIGFEAKGGGAEIFFQSVAAFDVQQHLENGTLVVNLALNRLGQNTWRMIDCRFFETPVAKITAKKVGASKKHSAGIEVRITFKNPKEAKEGALRSATEADGLYYAYLDFTGAAAPATMQDPEK